MEVTELEHSTDELEPAADDDDQSVLVDIDTVVTDAASQVATGRVELGVLLVEGDDVWDNEDRKVAQFVACGCSCNLGPKGTPCHKLFLAAQYQESRDECRELTREELDLVVMGELRALTLQSEKTERARDRVRTFSKFQYGGHRICLKTFCFVHVISRWKFTDIKSSWLQNGLRSRRRTQVTPHNATSLSDVKLVMKFILQYAEDHTILLPGRIPGYKRDDIQLLPLSTTKREVWELYQSAAVQHEESHAICYSLLCRLWKQLTPQIVVTKPMSDLCWTCQRNNTLIMRAHNRPVEEKTEVNTTHNITQNQCVTQTYTLHSRQSRKLRSISSS